MKRKQMIYQINHMMYSMDACVDSLTKKDLKFFMKKLEKMGERIGIKKVKSDDMPKRISETKEKEGENPRYKINDAADPDSYILISESDIQALIDAGDEMLNHIKQNDPPNGEDFDKVWSAVNSKFEGASEENTTENPE